LRELARNFASSHQTENPRVFSEVRENKQLLIAIVDSFLFKFQFICHFHRELKEIL
jgi:hypothetical protein